MTLEYLTLFKSQEAPQVAVPPPHLPRAQKHLGSHDPPKTGDGEAASATCPCIHTVLGRLLLSQPLARVIFQVGCPFSWSQFFAPQA